MICVGCNRPTRGGWCADRASTACVVPDATQVAERYFGCATTGYEQKCASPSGTKTPLDRVVCKVTTEMARPPALDTPEATCQPSPDEPRETSQ